MLGTGSSFAGGIVALLIAFALVWFGRLYSHTHFMNISLVFVTYPAVVLVFISFGFALLINTLW
jgi:hypothetical protein